MAMDDRPIIVVRKKSGHAAHHGGSWKVAYADFVTAMMAFFLVMWILGLNQDARKAIAAYFQDPVGFMKSHGGGSSPISVGRADDGKTPAIMPTVRSILNGTGDGARFKEAKEKIEKELNDMPEFAKVRKLVEITISSDGLRIELIESSEPVFFEMGSARIRPHTVHLLRLIGRELRKMPNIVAIEGHTDSRPYASGEAGYSNWELSADRANAARRAIAPALRGRQIDKVAGLADTRLRVASDPLHYSNRRISILVEAGTSEIGPSVAQAKNRSGSIAPRPVDLQAEFAVKSAAANKGAAPR